VLELYGFDRPVSSLIFFREIKKTEEIKLEKKPKEWKTTNILKKVQ
jgi:hypothetical protein